MFAANQHPVDASSSTFYRFDEHDLEFHDTVRNEIVAYPLPFGRYD